MSSSPCPTSPDEVSLLAFFFDFLFFFRFFFGVSVVWAPLAGGVFGVETVVSFASSVPFEPSR